MDFTSVDLQRLLDCLPTLPEGEQREILKLLEEYRSTTDKERARQRFIHYVSYVWPDFIGGNHHRIVADAFDRIVEGELKRLIINMAPRHTKSEFASWLLPARYLGRWPNRKVIQCSNTAELASGFGRRARNLINDDHRYHELYPGIELAADSKAAAHWHTNRGGEYFAIGVHGKVTGKGADLLVIDDPHALAIDTEIPTPEGFRTIEELEIGDSVFGPDGRPTRVIAKSPIYVDRPLYCVRTDDGEEIHCDAKHLWTYRSDTKLTAPYREATAEELADWRKASRPCLPRHAAVEYPAQDLPVNPYVLGVWLGNGTASLGRITSHLDDVAWFRNEFEAAGYETTPQADPHNFGVLGLRAALRDLGVLDNKHVPERYLTGSVDQRMALLQGLMDTDGTVTTAGQCSFSNTDVSLIMALRETLHSLGVKARVCCYTARGGSYSSRTIEYRVNFKLADACRIPRKRERTFTPTDKRSRSVGVELTDRRAAVQCITVEREDGLFLAGRGYVVTHNSEQEAKDAEAKPEIFDDVYNWYTSGPRQRLQPSAAIVIVMTRWSKRDLTGRLLTKMANGTGDNFEIITLPAILDENPHEPENERLMWPGYWTLKEMQATRTAIPVSKWQAQYQQNPTSEEGAIIKRDDWRRWPRRSPPACDYILQSWDTAFTTHTRSNYSACTTWGVFEHQEPDEPYPVTNLILLDAYRARMEFPQLKRKVQEFYDHWEPDSLLIEAKGSGASLVQELRWMGMPVAESKPVRGGRQQSNDKISRANAVSDVFASGFVWAPEARWAEEVIEECAAFPHGEDDDYVDTVTQALLRFREGGLIRTRLDLDDDDFTRAHVPQEAYY